MATESVDDGNDLTRVNDDLVRLLTRALRALGDAGQPAEANIIGGKAWSAIRHVHPRAAQRINGMMHYLAKLEGGGGVGSADATDVPVIRATTIKSLPGQEEELLRAARNNAEEARAAGALSADVCTDPNEPGVVVISRWAARSQLKEFLSWHEGLARESLSAFADGEPVTVHYPVVFR